MIKLLCFIMMVPTIVFGASGSEFSFGIVGGSTKAEQTHINTLVSRANIRAGGISTGQLDDGWEYGLFAQWKSDFFAFQLRPTMFTQSEEGTASGGSFDGAYEYKTSGTSVAGVFKLYPMETANMRFFFQTGVMWGTINTEIKEAGFSVEAGGSSMGYQVGAGLDFLFGSHVFTMEAGWRFLSVERNITSATSGTPEATSADQPVTSTELEYDGRDLSTNMSGTMLFVSYGFRF